MALHRKLSLTVACIAVCGFALSASTVEAQAWLSDRSRTEGPGFQVGDFVLHPGLGVELGYDTNIFYTQDDADPARFDYRDSAILRTAAHLNIATRSAVRSEDEEATRGAGSAEGPPVTFRAGLSGSFYHFFNDDRQTNVGLDANFALNILPGRVFSLTIADTFGRTIRPFTENFRPVAYARIRNDASLRLNFTTPGNVLRISLSYDLGLDFFEDAQFQYGNSLRHRIRLSETFRFFPQTAIIHDTSYTYHDVLNEAGSGVPRSTLYNDGHIISTRIGLNGAFTTNFSVLAMVGYQAGFYNFANTTMTTFDYDYESITAEINARWQIVENARLTFGYDRHMRPSFIGNYMQQDRGHIAFQTMIEGAFLIGAEVALGYYEFGAILAPDGSPLGTTLTRSDIRFTGSLFLEYRFTDWLGVNGTFRYTGSFTDYQYSLPVGAAPILDPAQFNKVELWLGVRVFY